MATTRNLIRRALSIAAGVGVAAVLHEFGVKYFEQMGWYDNLPSKLEAVMTWLASISEPLWFKVLTAFILGAAIGMWVDARLKDREQKNNLLDREIVAAEAERLSRKIGQIAAEGAARVQIAWEEESQEFRGMDSSGRTVFLHRNKVASARSWTLEKYGEYHFEVEAVIAKASKCISLDRADLWKVSNIFLTGHDTGEMSRFLAKISVALRYPQADLPMSDIRQEQMLVANQQGSAFLSQSPSEPGS